ncbi:TonB-dependent receptor [Alcaligenes ammonioxydans]|uniref:TonB-dependent siderophore receptor n=1 Tax=Alcaligenes ammonioxydans TaxID=2582914 RepID=UPI001F058219|nr:TonB-dependent receptor [Alcaligenes ammonioxydans]MCH1880071.1 TonB-dependent receptor [Alcaligenes ammonioxydans]
MRLTLSTPLAALTVVSISTAAHAQTLNFNLPAQPLGTALTQIASQAGIQVFFTQDLVEHRLAPPLHGSYTATQALQSVLNGSGLAPRQVGAGSYTLQTAPSQPKTQDAPIRQGETLAAVTVVASRTPKSIDETANTVWVIDSEQIAEQTRGGVSLKQMLGQLIPGLDLGGQSRTNAGQYLRGRPTQVMIDGISLNGSRQLSRQFDSIDPFNIERIEVLSGATAIHGGNATGGIINIITKRAEPGPARFVSELGVRSGLQAGDDLNTTLSQSVEGGNETVQGRLALSLTRNGGAYDSQGDRVLPDITQTDLQWNRSLDLMGTLNVDLQEAGELRLLAQYYDSGFKPGKALWLRPGPNDNILNPSELDIRSGFDSNYKPRTERQILAADYYKGDVLGGQDLYLKAYYRNESMRFYPYPDSDANPLVPGKRIYNWSVSTQETETFGLKAMLNKDWDRFSLNYGVDYDHETFKATQTMFDINKAMDSGGLEFDKVASLPRYPGFRNHILGAFAQADLHLTDKLSLSAGLRKQHVRVQVDDFVQGIQQRLVLSGYGQSADAIPGGRNSYGTTLFNAGLIYKLSPAQQVWANYSEGFELADPAKYYGTGASYSLIDNHWALGRHISVADSSMAAIKTRSTEVGWRYNDGPLSTQVALFHSQSDKSIALDRNTLNISLVDSKVRNYGLEGQLDLRLNHGWSTGASLLLIRNEELKDGRWQRRGIYYSSPSKATAYIGKQGSNWAVRAQVAHSMKLRSDIPSVGGGQQQESLPSLTLVDLLGRYQFDHSAQVKGTLSLGIQNLFNKSYETRWGQQAKLIYSGIIAPSVLDFRGQGRTYALTYTLQY